MAERLPRIQEPLPLALAVTRGRVVVRQGEVAAGLWVIESGAMLVIAITPEGRVLALDVLGPGDAIGEPEGIISVATVRALRPCRLRPIAHHEAPALMAARAARTASAALDLASLDVTERLRRRLDDLAARFGRATGAGTLVALGLTQDDLAALVGATRESVNRALRAMEAEGHLCIDGRRRWVVRWRP